MAKTNSIRLASDLRADLGRLAEILRENEVCADTNPIQEAIGSVEITEDNDGTVHLSYQLTRLVMHLGNLRKCFPGSVGNISCILSLRAKSSYLVETSPPHDPFDQLEINFVLQGTIPTQRFKHMQSWHFDRHIQNEDDNLPENAHPMYHFQFGGRRMEDHAAKLQVPLETAFGRAVLLDAPRLAHPPMDVVLAVDFVLSNFLGRMRSKLAKTNREYLRMVARSQARIWKPYCEAVAGLWTKSTLADPRWTPISVWPQYLSEPSSLTLPQ